MNCNRCGKWAGAHATLPGQPKDHLCMCATPPAAPAVGALLDRKDAERYRKLRAALGPGRFHSMTPRITVPLEPGQTYTPDGLDAALDALPAVGAA